MAPIAEYSTEKPAAAPLDEEDDLSEVAEAAVAEPVAELDPLEVAVMATEVDTEAPLQT